MDGPDLPDDGAHIWAWFLDLSAARGSNGFGANPISYIDIAAWQMVTSAIVRPSEVAMILELDRLWLADQAKSAQAAEQARQNRGHHS